MALLCGKCGGIIPDIGKHIHGQQSEVNIKPFTTIVPLEYNHYKTTPPNLNAAIGEAFEILEANGITKHNIIQYFELYEEEQKI